MIVGIEDPHRPYDNVAPLDRIRLAGQGLATSGSSRRGFRVAGGAVRPRDRPAHGPARRPRRIGIRCRGRRRDRRRGSDRAGVLSVAEALEVVAGWDGVECLIVDRERQRHESAGWDELRP